MTQDGGTLEDKLEQAREEMRQSGGRDELARWMVDHYETRIRCRDTIDMFEEYGTDENE